MSLAAVSYVVLTNEDWLDAIVIEEAADEGGDPEPVVLTGSSFRAHLRQPIEALHVALEATTANGRLVIAAQTGDDIGVLSWNVPKAIMQTIEPGIYSYDMVRTDPDGAVDTIAYGTVTVQRGVTRP